MEKFWRSCDSSRLILEVRRNVDKQRSSMQCDLCNQTDTIGVGELYARASINCACKDIHGSIFCDPTRPADYKQNTDLTLLDPTDS